MPDAALASTGWEGEIPTTSRYSKRPAKKNFARTLPGVVPDSDAGFPAEESHEESEQVGTGGRANVWARRVCRTEWSAGGRRAAGNSEWLLQGSFPHRERQSASVPGGPGQRKNFRRYAIYRSEEHTSELQ